MKRKPCPAVCRAALAVRRSHSGWPGPGRSDSHPGRSGRLSSRRSGCCRAPPGWARHRRTPAHECAPESRLPSADRGLLPRTCSCWRLTRRRTVAPAQPAPCRDHGPGSWRPPSLRTSFRRLCAPGATPGPVCAASAHTARKSNYTGSCPDSSAGTLPTPTATSGADGAEVAREGR